MTRTTTKPQPRGEEAKLRNEIFLLSEEIGRLKFVLHEGSEAQAQAKLQLEAAGERIDALTSRNGDLLTQVREQHQRANEAEAAERLSRKNCDELKASLHREQMENARLHGYIERVTEDDAAREGGEEVQRTEINPRRPSKYLRVGGAVMRQDTDGRRWG
jgi:hypothetical protein